MDAVRDDNRVTAMLGVSSADGTTPLPVQINPVTGRVLIEVTGVGSGDVVGPAGATDNAIARFDGVTGLLIQESIIILGDTGTMASTGDLGFSDQFQAGSGYATPLILSDASAEWDLFETNFGEVSLLNALNQAFGGGGNTLDQAYDEGGAGLGRAIVADSGAVSITVPDASNNSGLTIIGNDITNSPTPLVVTDAGSLIGVLIDKNAEGFGLQIDMDSDSATSSFGLVIDVNGAGTGAIFAGQFDTTYSGAGSVSTLVGHVIRTSVTGGGTAANTNCIRLQVLETSGTIGNATAIDLQNHTGTPTDTYVFRLDTASSWKSGESLPVLDDVTDKFIPLSLANTGITRDSEDIIFATTTSGDIHLTPLTDLVVSDGNQAGSTYGTELILSDNFGEWDTFETNFGEVSLLNAINQAAAGGGGETLAQTLVLGNITGGTDIQMTSGDKITAISADIILQNTTAGDVHLLALTDLVFSDGNKSGSTYATELILSDTSAEWNTFETNFGEVSLLNAINAALVNQTITLTGNVTGSGTVSIATTIAAGAVTVPMLANGTDGELITWDAAGAPTTVPVGTSGQVLTSNGVGTEPTFQAVPGGGNTLDQAYDQGGVGAGRAITADSGAVTITIPDTSNNVALEIINNDVTNNPQTMTITNAGTDSALKITQTGDLVNPAGALEVISTTNQSSPGNALVFFNMTNALSRTKVCSIENAGIGTTLLVKQGGVIEAGAYGSHFYSAIAQVNGPLVRFELDNASSTADLLNLKNDGSGTGLELTQGVLASAKFGIHILTSGNQTQATSALLLVEQLNSSSVAANAVFQNTGTGHNVNIAQNTDLAAGKYALYVHSGVAQTNSPLVFIENDHASAVKPCLSLQQDGPTAASSGAFTIDQNSYGNAVHIDIDYAGSTLEISAIVIDVSAANVPRHAFSFIGDIEDSTAGGSTQTQRVRVKSGLAGATRYIYLYSD
ncbi:hypothetical protein LCGC14_0568160 [marine sediment metagenome]|uniref:Uncharacterized protein n=1 Tax=marine sediment metagenome TaxID=412755 RepID=A0A0F9RQ79_9ZZZZ